MNKADENGANRSILETHYYALREAWHRTPFLHRIFSFTIVLFALLFACYVVLLVDDATLFQDDQNLERYPAVLKLFGDAVRATSAEGEASAMFAKNQTADNWATMEDARAELDLAQSNIAVFYKANHDQVLIDSDHLLLQGTRLSEAGIDSTYNARSQITQGQVILSVQAVRDLYYSINARLLQQVSKTAATLNGKTATEASLKAVAIVSIGWHLSEAMRAASVFTSRTSNTSLVQEALQTFGRHLNFVKNVASYALLPIQSGDDRKFLLPVLAGRQLDEIQGRLLIAITANTSYDTSVVVSANATFVAARALLEQIQGSSVLELQKIKVEKYARSMAMVIVAIATVVAAALQWGIIESLNAERNAIRIRNAHVMHDVLVRVGELVDTMASFALDPLPPPRSMMGTRVGLLELRLQHCLASLKTLAPTLPPLLFPKRLSALAADYSEVKDPTTMQFTRKPRDSLLKEPLQQVTPADIISNRHAADMLEVTKLQVHAVSAAFMFVDLSFFHEMSSVEKMQFSNETFHEVASMIEECVYQFKGVLHGFTLDRAIGVWNIADTAASNYCEQAATCSLVLANRLGVLRRHNRHLRDHFQVRIGVVAGPVRQGIFGDSGAKYLQLFGEPLERGIKVARANSFHLTTVACDETVRRAVDKIFLPKPIELLEDGACIYEVIHEASRREADLETQLLVYSKAFELYEKKYYREALRAFRAYTKLYGYDSSVERIQALITGM